MLVPVSTVAGEAVFVTARSALLITDVVVVTESFSGFGSNVVLATDAVFVMIVPCAASTLATSVTVSDAPAGSEANVTVRLLPEPLQLPAPVELQETKVTSDGRLSVTVTELASSGPLLVTVMV